MRARRLTRPRGAIAAAFAFAVLVPALAGCGGSNEAGSARERDEQRAYGRVVARSEVSPRRVTLGDPVVWTLTATLPPTSVPGAVRLAPAPATLEIVPRGEPTIRPARGAVVWSRVYDLRGFDLGPLPLPEALLRVNVGRPGSVVVRDSLLFPPDTLAVDSLTPAATGALSPDRGPVDPGLRPIDVAVAVGLALLVVGLLVALVLAWRRRRARPEPALPGEAPEAPFARALESLRQDGPALPRDAFHDRLSDAIRRYVTAATGVDAIDLTTRELERELRRSPRARDEAAAEVVRILRRSDLVKFARRSDAWEEAKTLLEDAARLSGAVAAEPAPGAEPAPAPTPAPGREGT
ncbi:MAG TPA: hypothetical protein VFS09_10845 [Candidatus Eisenbacteria bacterium]|nr:hypothetical protein [Candidatus Eisenbacteria bacterium]